ncbi:hypothetical protein FRC03_003785 [Tulasnella sp. 419]|nr:hypothetical protein FRC03_003785 [Tulasnella sp. 419]
MDLTGMIPPTHNLITMSTTTNILAPVDTAISKAIHTLSLGKSHEDGQSAALDNQDSPLPVEIDKNTGTPFRDHVVTRGGVGDLPGSQSEISVAKLPEERIHPEPYAEEALLKNGPPPVLIEKNTGLPFKDHVVTRGGVGDLPGGQSEISVAKLPEERTHPDPYSEALVSDNTSPADSTEELVTTNGPASVLVDKNTGAPFRDHIVTHGGVGDLPGGESEISVAKLPEERAHPDPYAESLARGNAEDLGSMSGPPPVLIEKNTGMPFKDHVITRGGVGDLPGGESEISIAKLPEERAHPDPYSESLEHKDGKHVNILASALDSNVKKSHIPVDENVLGIRPVTPPVESEAKTPKAESSSLPAAAAEEEQGSPRRRVGLHLHRLEGRGVDKMMGRRGTIGEKDGDSHLPLRPTGVERTVETPSSPKTSPKASSFGLSLYKTISGPRSPTKIETPSEFKPSHGRRASSSENGKASFMDKVKGEIKIISGMLMRDDQKVEEGKALMSPGGSTGHTLTM